MANAILKQDAAGNWMVLDKRSGQFLTLRGGNAMKSLPLGLQRDIDLTKPIAEQALERDNDGIHRRAIKS